MKSIRILLIEDCDTDATLVQLRLAHEQSFPHTLTRATCLTESLLFSEGETFDVIVTDLGMADGLGLETVTELHRSAPHLPIIVLTGNDDIEAGLTAIHKGAQDYLPKGEMSGSMLTRIIRHAIERKRLVRQLETALTEVKTLRGLLPICISCKQIRDDSGYWSEIETYVTEHSHASFTHGICPQCSAKFLEENRTRRSLASSPKRDGTL